MAYDEFLHRNEKTVLCSECPGWVCYAEKTIGEVILPHMSVVKSPQQLAGRIIKSTDHSLKVVTIMPCYDKKLEAVRPKIKIGDEQIAEIDTVLATHELFELFEARKIDFGG